MPNDCWNKITITGSAGDIKRFLESEFQNVPEWALKMEEKKDLGLYFHIWSRWLPDFPWLDGLPKKYPSIWIKNLWKEESGKAGLWIGDKDSVQRFYWDDISISDENYHFK